MCNSKRSRFLLASRGMFFTLSLVVISFYRLGMWGGHNNFGVAFRNIKIGKRKPDEKSRKLARHVIWWPERK